MIQHFIVYIILAATIIYIGYKFWQMFSAKDKSQATGCAGCSGCALKDIKTCENKHIYKRNTLDRKVKTEGKRKIKREKY